MKSFFRLFCILAPLMSAALGQGNVAKTPAVQAQMSKLYANARQSFVPTTNGLTRKTELSFTLSADGAPNQIGSSHDWAHDSVRVHRGDTAIVHTHPFGTASRPSDGDVAIAVKLGIPNYVLSCYALWVAMPDGEVAQVADVQWRHGQLVLKQRAPIPKNLAKQSAHPTSGGYRTSGRISQADESTRLCVRHLAMPPRLFVVALLASYLSREARNEGESGICLARHELAPRGSD